jgi:hypothetical protein
MEQPLKDESPLSPHRAFVVQFQAETNVARGRIVGRVEQIVDKGSGLDLSLSRYKANEKKRGQRNIGRKVRIQDLLPFLIRAQTENILNLRSMASRVEAFRGSVVS